MRKTKPSPALDAAEHKAAILQEGRRVTSYDVALLAGVSQSAVSRCFKPGASVSPETYARVMKAAEGLDYIPNAAARSLITRRSNIVAVIISNVANLYYPEALAELSQQLSRRGKRVLLFTMQQESDVEHILADVWQYQVDGVVAAARLTEAQIAEFARRRMPVVVFNRNQREGGVNSVVCDQYEGGRMLASRLAGTGHRQFGIIAGPVDSSVGRERLRGASDYLAEFGLPEPAIVTGQFDYSSGARGLRELITRLGKAPDAIICCNDIMAIGALDCARHELGIDVPGRMSIVGFDAVEPASWASYKLTTLRQPIQKMALSAADLLCTLIESEATGAPESRVFAPQFVDGETARLIQLPEAILAA
ncbi:LacI family DNA-binding transcriptional regulator [Pseudoduganella sp. RAF53_2]|uniref:LacI family DNA-binding transcriptional regulator n=1 Tax=unclassified Pseudoduganella TaxID=2637179 RepID=UPI003F972592